MKLCIWSLAVLPVLLACSSGGSTPPPSEGPVVLMSTSLGDITIALHEKKAPETVKNFLSYVNDGFYDGTIFHRVIPNFMIQGGGMTPGMQEKPTKTPITNEAGNGLKNTTGTLAMARTNDVNSATSQFFINLKNNDFLDHRDESIQGFGYCVFGQVTKGMEIVEKIAKLPTVRKGMHSDVPETQVLIKSVEVIQQSAAE